MITNYRQELAVQFSAFENSNGNPTIGIRTEEGSSTFLSLNGGARAITKDKLVNYGVTNAHFGKRLQGDDRVPITLRDVIDEDDGTTKCELASPAIADEKVMNLLDL